MDIPESTEEEQAAAMAQAVEELFRTPVPLPCRWGIRPEEFEDGSPCIVVTIQTPAGSQKLVLPRDSALELAADLRKAAQTGPRIAMPAAAGSLIVP